MDPRNTASFGRSASIPFLPSDLAQELDLQTERQQELEGALREIENSPGYRLMLARESENSHHFNTDLPVSDSMSSDCDGDESLSSFSSPDSDETVKPNIRPKTRNGPLSSDSSTHGSPCSPPANVPQHMGGFLDSQHNTPSILSTHASTFQPPARSFANALPKSSSAPLLGYDLTTGNLQNFTDMNQQPKTPHEQVYKFNGEDGYQSGGMTPTRMSSVQESSREQLYQPRGHVHGYHVDGRSPTAVASAQESPLTSLHQRKPSNRISSIPSMPSRLGPGHFMDDLGSDTSGLVSSPSSASKGQQQGIGSAYGQSAGPFNQASTPKKSLPPSPWNTPTRYAHDPNDPFVDHRPAFSPKTPTFTQSRSEQDPMTPSRPQPYAQPSRASQHATPTFNTTTTNPTTNPNNFTHTPPHPSPLPTPLAPPTLPTLNLHQTPQNRAHLAARLSHRQSWVQQAAAEIASLTRAHIHAQTQYTQQPTQANYIHWKRTKESLMHATNLDKRTEERRNLFMPEGTRAMRTGWGSEAGDGFTGGVVGGEGAGRLLGGEMAFLERVCLEGGRREGQESPVDLTGEEEKVARRYAVGVLGEAAERRRRRG